MGFRVSAAAAVAACILSGAALACDDARVTEAMASAPPNVSQKPVALACEGASCTTAKPLAASKTTKKASTRTGERTVLAREEAGAAAQR